MEKNAKGHRFRLQRDMIGYFDAARQQGRQHSTGCCSAALPLPRSAGALEWEGWSGGVACSGRAAGTGEARPPAPLR